MTHNFPLCARCGTPVVVDDVAGDPPGTLYLHVACNEAAHEALLGRPLPPLRNAVPAGAAAVVTARRRAEKEHHSR